jgi:hypothetical protein
MLFMKVRSLIPIYLMLALVSGAVAQQRSSAKPEASKKESAFIGTWKGESLCFADFKPACHDEVVVFYFSQSADKPGIVTARADKIVNGKEEDMGILDCVFDKSKNELHYTMPRGTWRFTVEGDKLFGSVWSPDGKQIRKANLVRAK